MIIVRKAVEDDIPAVLQIYRDVIATSPNAL